jgi:hypothetical protein
MRLALTFAALLLLASAASAEHQPYDRYQSIVDRQMFGRPPAGFDPTKPASMVQKGEGKETTKEQEAIKSAIHFSVINLTPDGATAVGFTDNSDSKQPVHYYLKVGEEKNGWKVVDADPVKATMTVVKGEVEVSLSLGDNSAKGGGTTAAKDAAVRGGPAMRRGGLLAGRRGAMSASDSGGGRFGSLRERRAAIAAEREAEEAEKAEKEKKRAEREEMTRMELQSLKDELKAQRDAVEAERAAREEERRAADQAKMERENRQLESNEEDDN